MINIYGGRAQTKLWTHKTWDNLANYQESTVGILKKKITKNIQINRIIMGFNWLLTEGTD